MAVEHGTVKLDLTDPKTLSAVAKQLHENIVNDPVQRDGIYRWGTLSGIMRGAGS